MRYSFSTNINLLLSLILLLLKYFILLKPLIPYLYHSSSSIDFAIFSLHISSSFPHVLANSFDIEFIYWWRIGIFYYANNIRQKSDYILKKQNITSFRIMFTENFYFFVRYDMLYLLREYRMTLFWTPCTDSIVSTELDFNEPLKSK